MNDIVSSGVRITGARDEARFRYRASIRICACFTFVSSALYLTHEEVEGSYYRRFNKIGATRKLDDANVDCRRWIIRDSIYTSTPTARKLPRATRRVILLYEGIVV